MADAAGTGGSGGGAGLYKVIKFISWLVYAFIIFAIIVLLFGFVLLLFAAKPTGFAETIYDFGTRFMNPFEGMITPTHLASGGFISWNALVAIAAYGVLAWIVSMIVGWASSGVNRARRAAVAGPASASGTATTTTSAQPPAATPQASAPVAQPAATPAAEPAAPTPATEPTVPVEPAAPVEPVAPANQEPAGGPASTA